MSEATRQPALSALDLDLLAGIDTGNRVAASSLFDELFERWERRDAGLDPLLDAVVARAVGGSQMALEVVLTAVHHLGIARPAIAKLIADPDIVTDVAQNTLVRIETNLGAFEGRSKFRTWVYSIARNEALMYLRKDQARPVVELSLDSTADSGPRISSLIATRASLRQAIDKLPDPYRRTMQLRIDDQLDYAEIASQEGVPVGTVRSRLAKGRELLSQVLLPT